MKQLLVLLALLTAGPPGVAQARILSGAARDVPSGARPGHVTPRAALRARASAANLPYQGGAVLHANRTHLIFWTPRGSGLGFDPGYQTLMETFLAGVAADSHSTGNVYGLSGQYGDGLGQAVYASTYAGSVADADPLPVDGCSEQPPPPLGTGPGWSVCLSDSQLMAEIQHVVSADGLPQTRQDIYFLITPRGLGSCASTGPTGCALGGGDDAQSYCGYHSSNVDGDLLYAVIPYNAVPGHCQSGNPRPNGSPADPALSTISHEHSETITDPYGTAWIDAAGNENGDLCISLYGKALGSTGVGTFNEVIHGGHYFLQEEWSNRDRSCQPRAPADAVAIRGPRRSTTGRRVSVTASAADPVGSIVRYDWSFGEGRPRRGLTVAHTYAHAGSFRISLWVTDSAGNWAFATRMIQVRPTRSRGRRT